MPVAALRKSPDGPDAALRVGRREHLAFGARPHHDGAAIDWIDPPNTAGSTEVALPWIVADLAAQGYTFVTVPEMASPC